MQNKNLYKIMNLYQEGMNATDISKKLDMHFMDVKPIVDRFEKDKNLECSCSICTGHDEGKNYHEISELVNRHWVQVKQHLDHRLNMKIKNNYSPEAREKFGSYSKFRNRIHKSLLEIKLKKKYDF